MGKEDIINLLDNSNITNDLKEAYTFMLLSKGYCIDEINEVLDDYIFLISKKKHLDKSTDQPNSSSVEKPHKRRGKRIQKNPVCYTSTSESYNNRDHTLYSFNGNPPVTKGRLVWNVVKQYQEEFNPSISEIHEKFIVALGLPFKTIVTNSEIETFDLGKVKRYYYHESDLIKDSNGTLYAVSNQWSIDKMKKILEFASECGWKIHVVN